MSRTSGRVVLLGLLVAASGAALSTVPAAFGDERSDVESKLEKAISTRDAENARALLLAATAPGDERAAKLIVAHAARMKPLQGHQALLDAMKQIKDEAGVRELIEQALKGPYAEMRYLYVEGLAVQGSPAASAAVLEALDDKDEIVSTCAARCARSLPTPDTVEKLIARLDKAELKPTEPVLAREVLGALTSVTGESLTFALEWKGWWGDKSATWKPRPAPTPSPSPTPAPAPTDKPADKPADKPVEGPANVMERLRRDRPEDAHALERLKDEEVIVVRGEADNVSGFLRSIKVPHKEINPDEVAKLKLNPASVLILNCNNRKNPYGEVEFAQIREFVEKGGYLYTSDTQLRFLLARAFPGSAVFDKIYTTGRRGETLRVAIVPAAPRHPLLRDVFPATSWDALAFSWAIDGGLEFGRLVTPEANVLVTSPECKKQVENELLAFVFRWRKGKVVPFAATKQVAEGERPLDPEGGCVLHVVPHMRSQGAPGDHFALEQLLLNFILERQRVTKHGG